MYHAGWAWAGSTPFKYTKLVASHFGGTRNPLVVSWPKRINPDKQPHSQFYHVNDIAPTLYELLGIKPPREVNGFKQDPMDGVSMAASFTDAAAPENKHVQYFDNNGSRGLYKDGWYACTFGPLIPWVNAQSGLDQWDSAKDVWELYDITKDFSQADNLAAQNPGKLDEMKKLFLKEAKKNKVLPHRRWHLAAHSSGGRHHHALQVLDLRHHLHAHARVHRAGPRQEEQHGHH